MRVILSLCALLGISTIAVAQDFALPTKMEFESQSGLQTAKPGTSEWSAEALLRYSILTGGGKEPSGSYKWSDDFDDGIGLRVEGDWEYHLDQRWSIGAYVSTGFDFFSGKTQSLPGNGLTATYDDWLTWTFTVGAKGKLYFGQGWFAELYLGFGFVEYPSTSVSISNGNSGTIYDASLAFVFEVGGHIGYAFNRNFGLFFGVGYENWGAPSLDSSENGSGIKPEAVENVTIDLGVWFRF